MGIYFTMGMKNIVYLVRNSPKKQMIIFFIISSLALKRHFIISNTPYFFYLTHFRGKFFVCFLAKLLPWKIASEIYWQVLLLIRPKYGGKRQMPPCSSRSSYGPGGKVAKCTCSLHVPMFSIGVVIEIRIISIWCQSSYKIKPAALSLAL